jgi:hypothetical protein
VVTALACVPASVGAAGSTLSEEMINGVDYLHVVQSRHEGTLLFALFTAENKTINLRLIQTLTSRTL